MVKNLALGLLVCLVNTSLATAEHNGGDTSGGATRGETSERPAAAAKPSSNELRKALVACAEKLGTLQPSKDYAAFNLEGLNGIPYVSLFSEKGTFLVTFDKETLETEKKAQTRITFPAGSGRTETLLVTVSVPDPKTFENVSVRVTKVADPSINPEGLATRVAFPAVQKGENALDSQTEYGFLSQILTPHVATDVHEKAQRTESSRPTINNIFEDVNLALDVQKAQTDAVAAAEAYKKKNGKDMSDEDLKKLLESEMSKAYAKHFLAQTKIGLEGVRKNMGEMLGALKACAATPEPSVARISKAHQMVLGDITQIHDGMKDRFLKGIGETLKDFKISPDVTPTADLLAEIHKAVAESIATTYQQVRTDAHKGLQASRAKKPKP